MRSAAFSFLKKYFRVKGVECLTILSWNIFIFDMYFLSAKRAVSKTDKATAVTANIPKSSLLNLFLMRAGIRTSRAAIKTFPCGRWISISLGRNSCPHREKDSSGPLRTKLSLSSSSWWSWEWLCPMCIWSVDLLGALHAWYLKLLTIPESLLVRKVEKDLPLMKSTRRVEMQRIMVDSCRRYTRLSKF